MTHIACEFDDHYYIRAHGRAPRGTGCWAFSITHQGPEIEQKVYWAPNGLTLIKAKKWMANEARALALSIAPEYDGTIDIRILS